MGVFSFLKKELSRLHEVEIKISCLGYKFVFYMTKNKFIKPLSSETLLPQMLAPQGNTMATNSSTSTGTSTMVGKEYTYMNVTYALQAEAISITAPQEKRTIEYSKIYEVNAQPNCVTLRYILDNGLSAGAWIGIPSGSEQDEFVKHMSSVATGVAPE